MIEIENDLVQLARLAIAEQADDVRLFIARLVRKYRATNSEMADQMDHFLRTKPSRSNHVLRKGPAPEPSKQTLPVDDESRLSLLKTFRDDAREVQPLLSEGLEDVLGQLIQERRQAAKLTAMGLHPTRSAIFVGQPGVGKTLTARWLAAQLGVPLYTLDLTAVMSSLLGKSGTNLRAVFDFAKKTPCVLLLDEIDSIAKRRSDESDIGELKRLVTVILQEVDEWPPNGLLIGATNHPELLDPAIWRRFDLVVKFELPNPDEIKRAIKRYLGPDYPVLGQWTEALTYGFLGSSFSDIERSINRFRRSLALGITDDKTLIEEFVKGRVNSLDRQQRIALAVDMSRGTKLSQHAISDLTTVSRDTIRKHLTSKN